MATFPTPAEWAQHEFGLVDLGDVRRGKRLVSTATILTTRPSGSLPRRLDWNELRAFYRLVDQDTASLATLGGSSITDARADDPNRPGADRSRHHGDGRHLPRRLRPGDRSARRRKREGGFSGTIAEPSPRDPANPWGWPTSRWNCFEADPRTRPFPSGDARRRGSRTCGRMGSRESDRLRRSVTGWMWPTREATSSA
jgi:hypothetical protein